MRARRTDTTHREVLRAIKLLGFPYRDLSGVGKGVQDVLVGIPFQLKLERDSKWAVPTKPWWLLVEVKTEKNKTNSNIWESQYTPAQRKWMKETEGYPRVTLTGFEDALTKLREMAGR